MNPLIGFAVALMIGAIIYLTRTSGKEEAASADFFKELAEYLESSLQAIPDVEEGFLIRFSYEGRDFTYEDIRDEGLRGPTRKGFLRMPTGKNFTMVFSERQAGTMRFDAKSIGQFAGEESDEVKVPRPLKAFKVHTTHPRTANALLARADVVKALQRCMSTDSRGVPQLSLSVREGEWAMTFHSAPGMRPSRRELVRDVPSIQGYLDRLIIFGQALEQSHQDS